jgi:bla regulator protein BlaR1
MMADMLSQMPAAMGAWSARLLDVSWQAGLVAVGAWLLCRLCPRMPAQVRTMLWWLVCAKFLVGLVWTAPLGVPLLPASLSAAASGAASGAVAHPQSSGALAPAPATASADDVTSSPPMSNRAASWNASASPGPWGPRVLLTVSGIWITGVLLQLALTYLAHRRMRTLVATSTAAEAAVVTLARTLSDRVGTGPVAVRISASIDTPRLTGAFTPTILLPVAAVTLSRADLEMTLCHELLHVHRGDLRLGWLPSAAQCVFFFHPCVWMATREYALAREAACDAAVLRVLGAAPDAYGALLLRLGIAHADIAPLAVGASSSFRTLKRRLIMLQNASDKVRARTAGWWIVAAVLGVTVVPLRVVARAPVPFVAAAPVVAAPAAAGPSQSVGSGTSSSPSTSSGAGTSTSPGSSASATSIGSSNSSPAGSRASAESIGGSGSSAGPGSSGSSRSTETFTASGSSGSRASSVGLGSSTTTYGSGYAYGYGDNDAWVLLRPGNHVSMSGSSDDIQAARRQRHDDEALLWFRHGGKAYVVRDQATLETVYALFAPMQRLGEQQGVLGERQGELGAQQGKLGDQQGRLGAEMGTLSSKLTALTADQLEVTAKQVRNGHSDQVDLSAMVARIEEQAQKIRAQINELGRRQEELGHQQEALGREQEELGRGQETFGRDQEAATKAADLALREILERALSTGLAQPVPVR